MVLGGRGVGGFVSVFSYVDHFAALSRWVSKGQGKKLTLLLTVQS